MLFRSAFGTAGIKILTSKDAKKLYTNCKFNAYADKVEAQMKEAGIRCSVDRRSEKMGYKIREARLERVPYMLVVGAKEEEEGKVSVRSRYLGDEGMKELGEFIAAIKEEIKNKTIRKIEVQEEKK